jgi:hypothetical protein
MVECRASDQLCQVRRGYSHRPLPAIPVLLRSDDPDLTIDLQSLIVEVYRRGRYRSLLDYTKPLPVPHSEDAACLADLKSPPG